MDKAGDGVVGNVSTIATVAKTPTEFVAVVLVYYTAFACFPAATTIDIPTANVLKHMTVFVAYLEIAYLTATHVAKSDVTLCAFGVDIHDTCLGDMGIAIMAQHHADVERVEIGT